MTWIAQLKALAWALGPQLVKRISFCLLFFVTCEGFARLSRPHLLWPTLRASPNLGQGLTRAQSFKLRRPEKEYLNISCDSDSVRPWHLPVCNELQAWEAVDTEHAAEELGLPAIRTEINLGLSTVHLAQLHLT